MQITNIKNETEDITINSTDNKKIQKNFKTFNNFDEINVFIEI